MYDKTFSITERSSNKLMPIASEAIQFQILAPGASIKQINSAEEKNNT